MYMNDNVFRLVKASLWGTRAENATEQDYKEMKVHAISALPAHILSQISMPEGLRSEWERDIIKNMTHNTRVKYAEQHLPLFVPYIVLKGSASAQYYPYPECRSVGDIDIMTREEDYISACNMLINHGWTDITSQEEKERGRHRTFEKNRINVEVHLFFASINDPQKAQTLDCLIRTNINSESHMLPDLVNGLVLIDHIHQHLRGGIGLRQIIDWMMFVNRCLPDEKWCEFEQLAEKTGMKLLTITVTKMCEMYLGLSQHTWSAVANKDVCVELMEYIYSCGNFGRKINIEEQIAIYRIGRLRHPVQLICDLWRRKVGKKQKITNGTKNYGAYFVDIVYALKHRAAFRNYYVKEKKTHNILRKVGMDKADDRTINYIDGEYVKRKL